jgi:hypothetical protein
MRARASYFGSRLKNAANFQLSLGVNMMRMIPFRFDNDCRKIINAIDSGQSLSQNFAKILQKIGQDPLILHASNKSIQEKTISTQKSEKKVQSLKTVMGRGQSRER